MKAVVFLTLLMLVAAVDGKKYCGQQYDRMVAMTCRFGKESTPCLGPARQCKVLILFDLCSMFRNHFSGRK